MLWSLTLLAPLAAALLMIGKGPLALARRLLCPAAALPALALALAAPAGERIEVSWLLLGTVFGLDPFRQIILLLAASLWLIAGLYAAAYLADDRRQRKFHAYYLLAMCGNFGLIIAEDIASFYLFFALMTFAGYGLVIHDRSERARRAGFIYLVMAVLGEGFLLAAIFFAVDAAGSTLMADLRQALPSASHRDLIMLCTFVGFGVKAGALVLHMWLPLAHPVAPTPASAVLSGAMIKAGLVGWLNLFPIGGAASETWGIFLILLGLGAAFYAVVVGLSQEEAKTNLAYSSVSQMGLMTVAVGISLGAPEAREKVLSVLAIYALSHGLAKGTLFLGVGVASAAGGDRFKKIVALVGLFVAAAAIAGGPFTSGAIAKKSLKALALETSALAFPLLEWALPLSSVATTLLLARFLFLIRRQMDHPHPQRYAALLYGSWALLLVLSMGGAWFAVSYYDLAITLPSSTPEEIWTALWPMLLGALLLLGAMRIFGEFPYRFPAGDIVVVFERIGRTLGALWHRSRLGAPDTLEINLEPYMRMVVESERRQHLVNRMERALASWNVAGVVFIALVLAMMGLLFAG
jgi:formate hydrogenlyase subunit 3/multisubunit Na+/H+ antiporter MnhD subunit